MLNVSGNVSLDGTLAVTLLDTFEPAFGQEFVILTSQQAVGGVFVSEMLPAFDGRTFEVDYNPTNVTLRVIPEPTGVIMACVAAGGLLRRRRRA